jgi:preprotein translocase subunit SecG
VGVVALIFLGLALVLVIFLLRRRSARKNWTPTEPDPHTMQPKYETPAKQRNPAAEAEGTPLTELADPHTDFGRSRW